MVGWSDLGARQVDRLPDRHAQRHAKHFNPENPNNTLNIDFKTGLNTNTAFGTIPSTASGTQTGTGYQIGGTQISARHVVLSPRFTF